MIYVENLPTMGESEIRNLFERFGSVTEIHRGPAATQIRMRDRESALNAVQFLNGKTVGGRRLRVFSRKQSA